MRMIKVELSENNMGDLQIDPVNKRILRKCKKKIIANHKEGCPQMHDEYQREDTEKWLNRGSCVYVQGDWRRDEIYNELQLTRAQRRDVAQWSLIVIVPIDTFDNWFLQYNGMSEDYFLS